VAECYRFPWCDISGFLKVGQALDCIADFRARAAGFDEFLMSSSACVAGVMAEGPAWSASVPGRDILVLICF
jgi:hypothetical protein